ncbi:MULTISPECIES: helix-turn-helix domain-containing protein [Streptomyces]|uniref:HTH luxR-type domain-containing protein n=1 Tax=Streptomyces venezuelae TaxID=54571 RepID=A0A5P2B116_STRVZ|nr:helix-turn-helix transcriptional regulator [Streptomyces venezuelae]QES23468.1 hypothetical protein DEJ46_33670 [Streptomyces venezuelae]
MVAPRHLQVYRRSRCEGGVPPNPLAHEPIRPEGGRQAVRGERVASLPVLSPSFGAGRILGHSHDGVKELLSLDSACDRMHEVAAESKDEVVAMLPGGGRPILELLECEPPLLAPGLPTRLLFQHTARFDSAAREQAEVLIGTGALIRTVAPPFGQLIVFDAATAFIPVTEDEGSAVAVIQDATVVSFLYSCFGRSWAGARDFAPGLGELDLISDDLKGEILQMLINGAKDETIARRLGLSVRTCRKYIAQLMQKFGAVTRFQLGYAVSQGTVPTEG